MPKCRHCGKAVEFKPHPRNPGKLAPFDADGEIHFATCGNPEGMRADGHPRLTILSAALDEIEKLRAVAEAAETIVAGSKLNVDYDFHTQLREALENWRKL